MLTDEFNGWRTLPAYTASQAARLAKTSPTTVRRWLHGYEAPGHRMQPVFGDRTRGKEQQPEVSFLMLAEIVVVSAFRKRKVKLDRLRRAHAFAKQLFHTEYPFASLRLKTDGGHVLHEFEQGEPSEGSLLVLDKHGQWTLPGGVVTALDAFEFESELAARWFPLGKMVPIVVDPRFGAGRPTIPSRGVTIETLLKRWKAGQPIDFIARDYKLPRQTVEAALQNAESLAA